MENFLEKFSLQRKKAIVTGGAKGLCYSIAEGLHEAGAEVVLVDIVDEVKESAEVLGKTGAKTHYVQGDLSDLEYLPTIYQTALEKLGGRVDILLNGAGIQYRCKAEDFPQDKWLKIIDINLNSVFLLAQLAGKQC